MHASYDGIVFDLVMLEKWERQAMLDPTEIDFLYWHHLIDMIVTVGGDANDARRFPPLRMEDGPERTKSTIKELPLIAPNELRKFKSLGLDRVDKAGSDLNQVVNATPNLKAAMKLFPAGNLDNVERRIERPGTDYSIPWTDNEIKLRLAIPRRQLLVWTYSEKDTGAAEFLLVSPLTGAHSDAMHGPKCTIMSLPTITGNVSMIYRLRFETWECPLKPYTDDAGISSARLVPLKWVLDKGIAKGMLEKAPLILSNRWSMRQIPDESTYLSNFAVEGTAIFNMAALSAQKVHVDQLRKEFMHPLSLGFVRMPPIVEISAGGNAVKYSFVDKQVMTNFHAGHRYGLISIDIKQAHQYHTPIDAVQG